MAKVAVVSGGTRSIGAAISRALKAAGYTVVANYAGNDEAAAKHFRLTGRVLALVRGQELTKDHFIDLPRIGLQQAAAAFAQSSLPRVAEQRDVPAAK